MIVACSPSFWNIWQQRKPRSFSVPSAPRSHLPLPPMPSLSPSSLVTSTMFGIVDDDDEMASEVGKMVERFGDNITLYHPHVCSEQSRLSFTKPAPIFSTTNNDHRVWLRSRWFTRSTTCFRPHFAPSSSSARARPHRRKLDAWPTNKREIASFRYLALTSPTLSSSYEGLARHVYGQT